MARVEPSRIYIYALSDPRSGEIRYVGKTNSLEQRYLAHLSHARTKRDSPTNHCRHWVRQLLDLGLRPEMTVLEETTLEGWSEAERRHIDSLRQSGCRLTNHAEGGVGGGAGEGSHRTHLTRDDVRDILERRARGELPKDIGKRYSLHPSSVHAIVTGRVWSHLPELDEVRKQAQESLQRGKRGGSHYIAKIRDEDVPVIFARYVAGERQVDIGRDYGVTQAAIERVLHRKSFAHVPVDIEIPHGRSHQSAPLKGASCPWARLTNEQAREARERFARGDIFAVIARDLNTSNKVLWKVVHGESYRDAGGPITPSRAPGYRRR